MFSGCLTEDHQPPMHVDSTPDDADSDVTENTQSGTLSAGHVAAAIIAALLILSLVVFIVSRQYIVQKLAFCSHITIAVFLRYTSI